MPSRDHSIEKIYSDKKRPYFLSKNKDPNSHVNNTTNEISTKLAPNKDSNQHKLDTLQEPHDDKHTINHQKNENSVYRSDNRGKYSAIHSNKKSKFLQEKNRFLKNMESELNDVNTNNALITFAEHDQSHGQMIEKNKEGVKGSYVTVINNCSELGSTNGFGNKSINLINNGGKGERKNFVRNREKVISKKIDLINSMHSWNNDQENKLSSSCLFPELPDNHLSQFHLNEESSDKIDIRTVLGTKPPPPQKPLYKNSSLDNSRQNLTDGFNYKSPMLHIKLGKIDKKLKMSDRDLNAFCDTLNFQKDNLKMDSNCWHKHIYN